MKKTIAVVLMAIVAITLFISHITPAYAATSEVSAEQLTAYAEVATITITKTEVVYSRGRGTDNYIFFEYNGEGYKLSVKDAEYALIKEGDSVQVYRTKDSDWALCRKPKTDLYVINLLTDGKRVYSELSDGQIVRVSKDYPPVIGEDVFVKSDGNILDHSSKWDTWMPVIWVVMIIFAILFGVALILGIFW